MSLWSCYDPVRDQIINAKPGTISYYHEEGHREFWQKGYAPQVSMWSGYFSIGVLACVVGGDMFWARVLLVLTFMCVALDEGYAWAFAIAKVWLSKKP